MNEPIWGVGTGCLFRTGPPKGLHGLRHLQSYYACAVVTTQLEPQVVSCLLSTLITPSCSTPTDGPEASHGAQAKEQREHCTHGVLKISSLALTKIARLRRPETEKSPVFFYLTSWKFAIDHCFYDYMT